MFLQRFINFKKRTPQENRIQGIKGSKLFDEEYYLENNADVKEAGFDPATHFYLHGWREYRNPSKNLDIKKFLKDYPEIKKLKVDPITYILDNKVKIGDKYKVKKRKYSIKKILKTFFPESTPIQTLPVSTSPKRINIIFNGFDKACFFGGKATALLLAIKFVQKYGYKLRIIAQDPERKIFYEFLELFNIEFNGDIEFYSTESTKYLEIGKNDHVICTMWSNADSVLNTKSLKGKIFYIMQEVETFFYDHGDYHLRCYNTLTSDSLIPIVNSKLLYDYLSNHGYENVKNNGVYFEPAFSKDLLKPSEESFKKKKKYKLFFYARPSHQRNLFYFGIDILNKAFLKGVLDSKEWEVYLAGDKTVSDFKFDSDVKIKNLGLMNWAKYCEMASNIDLCFSMIYTPHPSYPPLDFATCGAVVLTNKYQNKQDLHKYSKNIVSADLNEEDILRKFKEASLIAKDFKTRQKNYKGSNIIGSWDESFKDILPFMENKIGSGKDV